MKRNEWNQDQCKHKLHEVSYLGNVAYEVLCRGCKYADKEEIRHIWEGYEKGLLMVSSCPFLDESNRRTSDEDR